MRVRGRRVSPLLLALFVSLSVVALLAVAPALGGKPIRTTTTTTTSTITCSVSVTYSLGTFYVKTTVTDSDGSLPGPTETEYLASYQNGVLYDTQSVEYRVSGSTATITITVPVSSNGAGNYAFNATILSSKGSQLATCSGTYSL